MIRLESLGWDAAFASALSKIDGAAGLLPARVSQEHREAFRVLCAEGEIRARPTGRLHHETRHTAARPVVGDWVAVSVRPGGEFARIHHVLPRATALTRKVAAERVAAPQVVVANVTAVFVTMSLNRDFNPRRLERALTIVWESGAAPVVLLTKGGPLRGRRRAGRGGGAHRLHRAQEAPARARAPRAPPRPAGGREHETQVEGDHEGHAEERPFAKKPLAP